MTAPAVLPVTGLNFPVVDGVTAAVYEIPTDQPEADGTLAWSSTTLVIARVSAGGRTGLGYTNAASACKPLIEGEPYAELYVDANGGYRGKQAVRMASAVEEHNVTWFEELVSSNDLDGLREVRDQVTPDVAAGEYGYDLAYFTRMVDAGAVDCRSA